MSMGNAFISYTPPKWLNLGKYNMSLFQQWKDDCLD